MRYTFAADNLCSPLPDMIVAPSRQIPFLNHADEGRRRPPTVGSCSHVFKLNQCERPQWQGLMFAHASSKKKKVVLHFRLGMKGIPRVPKPSLSLITREEGQVSAVASSPETHTSCLMQPLQMGNNLTVKPINR